MKSRTPPAGRASHSLRPGVFAALLGAFFGLCLVKFGSTPVMEQYVATPAGFWEVLLSNPWPIAWAYWLLAPVTLAGIVVAQRRSPAPAWLVTLPLAWLVWQLLAGTESADAALTSVTLKHFAGCAVCFYLGYFCLSRLSRGGRFWVGVLGGLVVVLAIGWQQHFGGLKETRRYFFLYIYPTLKEVSPEYLKKIASDRIFSTLFYPNALAGALLLLLPVALAALGQLRGLLTAAARAFLMGVIAVAGLACLYWSGSKGGWLLMLGLGLVALLRLRFSRRLKVVLVAVVLVAGLTGFFWRYAAFFEKGATSVSARFDYWRAAVQTAVDKPLFGTGPGTFKRAYENVKRPQSEMARLVHNDYLEQASDSGWVGLVAYTVFIVGALWKGYPRREAEPGAGREDWLTFAVWLGVLGWALQGLLEFGLYIPALAWPAFALLGWLLGKKPATPSPAPAPKPPERRE